MNRDIINKIGQDLCACTLDCCGIKRNQRSGDFPRGLNFEDGQESNLGTVVCGQNPGNASQAEKEFILTNGGDYAALVSFWETIRDIRYFRFPRAFVRSLGRSGPILWTDLVKCENESTNVSLSFRDHSQTFRTCTSKFLLKELEQIPKEWLVVCLGWEAFRGMTYLCPDRPVLGIPHPAVRDDSFLRFFHEFPSLKNEIRRQVLAYFEKCPQGAIWLPSPRRET